MSDRPEEGFKGLRLHNTLSRTKEDFVPIDPSNVRMYVCGPTVYDFAHIGNARPAIVFDVLFRLLRHLYGEGHVTYVRNVTDVDDKINARAGQEHPDLPLNEAIRKVTETTEAQYHADVAALGCLQPTHEPRATEHMGDIVAMIAELVAKGHAYEAEGHVLFDVRSWKGDDGSLAYGRLANRSLDDMVAGARVEVAPYKRDPMDFVLWKPSAPNEPAWDSPWGKGRPGWHIECSAMAGAYLGDTFDIHGGGIDLVFPHHENEVAQSRCAHGTGAMANYWLHNGFLQVEGEKMSKSLGNFVTIRELLDGWKGFAWPGEVLRYAMLTTHYRQPIDFSLELIEQAAAALAQFATSARPADDATPSAEFVDAMLEDLNTPRAIAELHRLQKVAARNDAAASQLYASLKTLGFDTGSYNSHWIEDQSRAQLGGETISQTEALVAARLEARRTKDFAEADRIRAELEGMGIQLMDRKDPATGEVTTEWEVRRWTPLAFHSSATRFPPPLRGRVGRGGILMPHRDVSTTKRNNARPMRVEMTDAERKLWHAIKAHRLRDFAFRRQVPIGPYIADFVCHQASLIVEVDGGQHSESASDEQRDAWFVDHGLRVVRFWNNDVLTNLDGVLVRIIEMVERDSTTPLPAAAPPPSPSRGEGLRRATGEVTTEWEVKR